jgi:hypothetical protein
VELFCPVLGTGLIGLCPGLALVQGEFAYVLGELMYALVVCALCLSIVFLGCLEPLPLPFSAFDRLLEFLFYSFLFFFPFL